MNAVVKIKPSREAIDRLQQVMSELPQIEIQTAHFLCDGMYIRTILIPKGAALIGRVHKKEHFFMVVSGDITVMTETGMVRFTGASAPLVSKPGIKRAGWAHEDTIFMTMHRTQLTDIERIEEEISEVDPTSQYLTGNVLKSSAIGGPS